MADFKPITYDALLMLSEQDIRDLFPCGAVSIGKKWQAAETKKEAEKTLARLLRDKRARQEKPRYLRQSSSVPKGFPDHPDAPSEPGGNYTTNPKAAVGVDKHGRGEPLEAVPEDVQRKQTAKGHARFADFRQDEDAEQIAKDDARRIAARLKSFVIQSARCGADPVLLLAGIERQLAAAEAQLNEEAA